MPVRETIQSNFLTKVEKELYNKIVTIRIQLSKIEKKLYKIRAITRAAKKITSNLAILNVLENSSSTAKLLSKIQCRENRKQEDALLYKKRLLL